MLHLQFTPFPVLHTERLLLRSAAHSDAADILAIRNHEVVNKYIVGRAPLASVQESEDRINYILQQQNLQEVIMWCICYKENPNKVLGSVVYWHIVPEEDTAEIGYELHPDFHNKGIMSEALRQILQYGKQHMLLKKITAYTHLENTASKRLLQKLDFERDTLLEQQHIGKTEPDTTCIYSLIVS